MLQVINSSHGDLVPVFEAILAKAHNLCDATKGAFFLFDGAEFQMVAGRGISEVWTQVLRRTRGALPGPRQQLLSGATLVQILDASASDNPMDRDAAALTGARTILFVPLRRDSALLGYITAYRQQVRPFSDKQIALLQYFATQAVIAVENARLLDEIRQRQEELRVTFENMGDGVALFDETRHLVASNRRFQDMLSSDMMTRMLGFFAPAIAASNGPSG